MESCGIQSLEGVCHHIKLSSVTVDHKMPPSSGRIVFYHVKVVHAMVITKFTKNSGQFLFKNNLLLLASQSESSKTHFSPNKEVNKCNVCLYEELENGGLNGNKNCDGGIPDGAEDSDCPAYADAVAF